MSKFQSLVKKLVECDPLATPRSWREKLPEEARAEVDAIKSRFLAGDFGRVSKRAMARAIVTAAKERGWHCTESGVREWLAKN